MIMASPLVGRSPTCLSCIRRLNQVGSASISLTQVRGKKSLSRPKNPGVVVRLLQDVKKYGKEGSIFRAPGGTMRNKLFPTDQAEYMTRERFKELGLSPSDIGERDHQFGTQRKLLVEEVLPEDAIEHVAGLGGTYAPELAAGGSMPGIEAPVPAMEVEQLAPDRALELMEAMIPETLIFERHPVHIQAKTKKSEPETPEPKKAEVEATPPPEPKKPKEVLSPLQQRRQQMIAEAEKARTKPEQAAAEVAADKEKDKPASSPLDTSPETKTEEDLEKERKQMEKDAEELLKIHGSVSLQNIASYLKEKMMLDPEASRIHVQPEDVRFLGLEEGVDHVKKIGTFEIEVRTHVGKVEVQPIRRLVEVVPY
ncbi:hypothetical protein N0V93_003497 [Gnomoniopsis smithogilvyi]|uniref:Ribosomal protein L9 domain-containing protein n=1 Tax=Gnomoniopsis smithogilvyi TaxID=1191159 RepID=A0A9W8Z0W1_9PEZI|nr:hypothetical protein N0V93_003497 [Gnomoniopsis smithogilvyi]